MTNKKKKELDNVLQIVMPDDYYKDMRKLLLPRLIRWHENEIKKIKESKKKKCKQHNLQRIGGAVDMWTCLDCGEFIS